MGYHEDIRYKLNKQGLKSHFSNPQENHSYTKYFMKTIFLENLFTHTWIIAMLKLMKSFLHCFLSVLIIEHIARGYL